MEPSHICAGNFITFSLNSGRPRRNSITRLLGFFGNAFFLRKIALDDSIPESSNAPSGKIGFFPSIDMLSITAGPVCSILTGSENVQLREQEIPTSTLPLGNFRQPQDLSYITVINLRSGMKRKCVRMNGSRGELDPVARWEDTIAFPYMMDPRIIPPSARLSF